MQGLWRTLAPLLVLVGALCGTPVLAGWTEATIAGELNDVQVWGPGTFTASTTQGAFHFVDGLQQGSPFDAGANVTGAFWEAGGCVTTLIGPTGAMRSSCGPTSSVTAGVVRLRHLEQGGAGYLAYDNAGAQVGISYYPQGVSPGTAGNVSSVDSLYRPLWPMDVVLPANHSFPIAVFQVQFGGTATTAFLLAQGGILLTFPLHVVEGLPLPGSPLREMELLVRSAGSDDVAHVFLAAPDGLYRIDTSPIGQGWQPQVRVEAAPAGQSVEGLGLSEDRQAATQGHGMLLLWDGTRSHLRRAVPVFRGATPGAVWVDASAVLPPAPAGMSPKLISCEGAHTCVVGHSGGGQTHLAIYRNEGGPTPSLSAAASTVGEGTQAVFTVGGLVDPDADPLGLRWRIRHGAQEVTPVLSAGASHATVDTSGFEVCGAPEVLNAQLEVSDGLEAHEIPLEAAVSVTRTRSPRIQPDGGRLDAGASQLLEVLPDDFAVCLPSQYAWEVTGPASLSTASGSVTTLTVEGPACSPEGATVTVEASALGTGGWVPATPATFHIPAWGSAPVPFGPAAIEQPAGTTEIYAPQRHACRDSAGFPGQRTVWTAVGAIPAGVSVSDGNGQPVDVSGPFEAAELRVATDSCAQGTLNMDVLSEVEGVSGTESQARLRVEVVRFAPPISEADLTLSLDSFEGGVLTGRLGTDVSCPDEEGWRAALVVLREGVPVMGPVHVSPQGDFELNVPALCAGGAFTLEATLQDPSGASGVTRQAPFEAAVSPVRVGQLVDSEVIAACGDGARGALTLQPPAGACLGATWTWTQLDGPALTEPVLHGRSVRVQSAGDPELSALVGSTLRFEVVAEAEGVEPETRVIEIGIGSEILVEVAGRAETALVRDDSFFGARLEVQNVTRCALSGLEVQGVLTGAVPAGDAVSISGTPHAASWEAPRLTVREVALEGSGEMALELLLAPSLLGPEHTRLGGEVHLNGVRISREAVVAETPVSPTGCGCNGSGGPGWALPALLAGLFLTLRGRR